MTWPARAAWFLLLWAGAAPACAHSVAGGAGEAQRILVMMPLTPVHFRPDADYAGAYDPAGHRAARVRSAGELAANHGLRLVQDWPMPSLGVDCFVMELGQGASVQDTLAEVRRDPRVESAQALQQFRAMGPAAGLHDDPLFAAQPAATLWHLGELHRVATGRSVLVAQVDSGVDTAQPDLEGQVADAPNLVDGLPYAAEDHGTAVAGIVAARADNGVGIAGVAPHARLLALRACWQVGADATACNSFTLAKALQWALERDARVVNMSLSGPADPLLARLLAALWQRGSIVVAAADASQDDGGFPASDPHVLGVRSEEDAAARAGTFVRAPGTLVPTTQPGGRWGLVSGSSYAAAHVTGLVALMLELDPGLRPQGVREAIVGEKRRVDSRADPPPEAIDACAVLARVARAPVCHSGTGLVSQR